MELVLVDFSNYKEAIEVQNKIFSYEDGTLNILASLDRELFIQKTKINYIDDNVKYYLVKENDKIIGITGLYSYNSKEEVWLGWFGVLDQYRGKKLGYKLLNLTIDLAKEEGFKIIRLYTDKKENAKAIKLYEECGFNGYKYLAEKLDYDCYIYSKSLIDDEIVEWDNRNLNLSYQSELDQMDKEKIQLILNMYDEM